MSKKKTRANKRGKKTKKNRSRYKTDWREPKLILVYVVDKNGEKDRKIQPIMDASLDGSDATFAMLLYLNNLGHKVKFGVELVELEDTPVPLTNMLYPTNKAPKPTPASNAFLPHDQEQSCSGFSFSRTSDFVSSGLLFILETGCFICVIGLLKKFSCAVENLRYISEARNSLVNNCS
ncbi:MAG: hypothetical protein ACD_45C00255G0001 [uncultured bacterium]|nr:MAG: hypothetical protein ACD_45C00255G0001 [uncultured bacterium]